MDKKEFSKLYKKLPEELQDLVTSPEMEEDLYRISKKHGSLQYLSEINSCTAKVLLGLLPPNEFEEAIQKELEIDAKRTKEITREINRFVFYPVKSLLEDMYNMEIAPIAKMEVKLPADEEKKAKEIKKSAKSDTYREPIEL